MNVGLQKSLFNKTLFWDQKLNRGSKRRRFVEDEEYIFEQKDNFHISTEYYLADKIQITITKKMKFELEMASGNNTTIQSPQENHNNLYNNTNISNQSQIEHIENSHLKEHYYNYDQRKSTQESFSSIDKLINCKLHISTRTNPYEEINSILNHANQLRNTNPIDCMDDYETPVNNNYNSINSLLREAFLRRHHN
ncbi:13104_t:CDS:2 [Entrophospora sp. SA101]|nr:13111_t:CDS:2 [Entrophospora candida]CAG8627890.1 15047_t:CDS:2 [Entrophospora candida]CAH1766876.1 1368_t:CDS:2 [Entrophospora sp. SA101]CAJ0838958.1 13104_t:CDS:2 [Entrophospora sp. SA101]